MSPFSINKSGIILSFKVKANKNKTEIISIDDDYIYIHVAAVPDKEKANKEIIKFLSELLEIPKNTIEIESGEHCPIKAIRLMELKDLEFIETKIRETL